MHRLDQTEHRGILPVTRVDDLLELGQELGLQTTLLTRCELCLAPREQHINQVGDELVERRLLHHEGEAGPHLVSGLLVLRPATLVQSESLLHGERRERQTPTHDHVLRIDSCHTCCSLLLVFFLWEWQDSQDFFSWNPATPSASV